MPTPRRRGLTGEVDRIDAAAKRLGISRNKFLRRHLEDATLAPPEATPTIDDLRWFAETFSDLGDPGVMDQAWR